MLDATVTSEGTVKATRIGVRSNPPALVLDYVDPVTNKPRRRVMPIKQGEAAAGCGLRPFELRGENRKGVREGRGVVGLGGWTKLPSVIARAHQLQLVPPLRRK